MNEYQLALGETAGAEKKQQWTLREETENKELQWWPQMWQINNKDRDKKNGVSFIWD